MYNKSQIPAHLHGHRQEQSAVFDKRRVIPFPNLRTTGLDDVLHNVSGQGLRWTSIDRVIALAVLFDRLLCWEIE